jgi:LuxR family maltose regulon positive regulatory protein
MAEVLSFAQTQALAVQSDRLLMTKLFAPRARIDRVPRPRLTSRLTEGLQRKMTLISAPAGFGKTTLLSEWRETSDKDAISVAWVSLDKGDNDLMRVTYLIAALQTVRPNVGTSAQTLMETLRTAHADPPRRETVRRDGPSVSIETVLTCLINDLATTEGEIALILDDAHVIEAQSIHDAIEFLLEHLPSHVHLIIASRTEPPLALSRLRARDQIAELHASDLRFTADEIAEFFRRMMKSDLPLEEVDKLAASTEGWAAGLQLAALSWRQHDDLSQRVSAISGSDRYILDYLVEEVLQRQTEDVQTFLLETAILDRLSGPLCDAVTGQTHGQTMLERLERSNLFVVPLDTTRQWYRYHHLFADLLRDRLGHWQPDLIPVLHRRAAEWYHGGGFAREAIQHALAGKAYDCVVEWLEPIARDMLGHDDVTTLYTWLSALPQPVLCARPGLALKYAWAQVLTARHDDAQQQLAQLEATLDRQADDGWWGELNAIRASIAIRYGDYARAQALLQEAWQRVPSELTLLRGVIAVNRGVAQMMQGQIDQAATSFAEAAELSRAAGNLRTMMLAFNNLGVMYALRGQLRQAADTHRRAIAQLEGQPDRVEPRPVMTNMLHISLGETLYEWNDLDGALSEGQRGMSADAKRATDEQAQLAGYLLLARIQQAQGNVAGAFNTLAEAKQFAEGCKVQWYMVDDLVAMRARLNLLHGDASAALQWADTFTAKLETMPEAIRAHCCQYFTLARVLISHNPQAALELLDRLLPAFEATQQLGGQIESWILRARAHHALGRIQEARAALREALILAEPESFIRLFVDEGEAMQWLVADYRSSIKQPVAAPLKSYADRLLAAFSVSPAMTEAAINPQPTAPENLVEPLSERELEILCLIADGLSNQAIADKLIVALSTIKWHINHLYAKLDAHSRTLAVARAKELGLL